MKDAQNSKEIGQAVMELFGSQSPEATIDVTRLQYIPWDFKKRPQLEGDRLGAVHLSSKSEGGCREYCRHILSNLKTRAFVTWLQQILINITSEHGG